MVGGKWLQNISGKNQGHTYIPYTIETGEPFRPYDTLEWTNIGGTHTQNTEAYTAQTTIMKATYRNGESKMQQED
jgi:hypothetical protein